MSESGDVGKKCEHHPECEISAQCSHCGKDICRECVQEFGYFCSEQCRTESAGEITEEDRQAAAVAQEELRKVAGVGKIIAVSVVGLVLLGAAALLWRFVLDPSGKLCWHWQRDCKLRDLTILGADEDHVMVRAGDHLVTLTTKDGAELSAVALPEGNAWFRRFVKVDGGLLVCGGRNLMKLAPDGTRCFEVEFQADYSTYKVAADGRFALLHVPAPLGTVPAAEGAPEPKQRLVCVDLSTGKERWSKALKASVLVSGLGVGRDVVTVVFAKATGLLTREYTLFALSAADGKRRWQIDLPGAIEWGPVTQENLILFETADEVHAVTEAGDEAWTVDAPPGFAGLTAKDGLVLAAGGSGTTCYDVKTGDRLWQSAVQLREGTLVFGVKRLFALAAIPNDPAEAPTEPVKLPDAYQEHGDVLKELGVGTSGLTKLAAKTKPGLVCLDRQTGETVWTVKPVLGELRGDAKRLVVVMDTSETSMLEMMGGGKGVNVVRQYDPSDGTLMYSRQSDWGMRGPVLAGRRLVGLAYERVDKPGLLSGGIGFGPGAAPVPEPKGQGVIAFHIK